MHEGRIVRVCIVIVSDRVLVVVRLWGARSDGLDRGFRLDGRLEEDLDLRDARYTGRGSVPPSQRKGEAEVQSRRAHNGSSLRQKRQESHSRSLYVSRPHMDRTLLVKLNRVTNCDIVARCDHVLREPCYSSDMLTKRNAVAQVILAAAITLSPSHAWAQASGASGESVDTVAPVLRAHPEAIYPLEAKRRRIEANVGLELELDAAGKVASARVTAPAGQGFDEAALTAARAFEFEPARQAGVAVRSTVQFTYEFHLPADITPTPPSAPRPPPRAPLPPATPELTQTQTGANQSTLVLAQRPISAASSMSVRDRDFQLRPIASVADILRVTPGLLVVQHSGGGKANQYFLRGFDADHGTDIAFSIDGIPINMVSHGHGQGFSDTSFIIPETVERIEISKGPYFADQGDFATAGAVNLVTRRDFEHSSIGFGTGGSPGRGAPMFRALLVASPKLESIKPFFAAEVGRNNGPFTNPERFDRYKVFSKATWDVSPTSSLSFGVSSYAGNWNGSGQIAQREVNAGRLDRFGTHDPTEGGDSARHQLFGSYKLRPSENSEIQALFYLAQYRLNIYSNFTLYRDNPDEGDAILQRDRRTMVGGKASYRIVHALDSLRFDTTMGANVRSDDVDNQLDRQRERRVLASVRNDTVHETSIGAFAREEVTLTKWLRLVGAGRADFFSFAVDDKLVPQGPESGSGVKGASQLSPKGSVVLSPVNEHELQLDVYGNYGHGFHSNDARGVVLADGAVTPLTRAIGGEVGSRARLFDRLDLAFALWRLDLQSETVWVGDEGTTEAGAPTRRYGIEFESRYELTKWLAADLDVTATKSTLTQNAGNGDAVALAPRYTWAGGLSVRHPSGFRGGFRFYGVGDRPATQDYPGPGSLVADGFTVFDLHAGYRHRRFDVALDVENLFNTTYKSAQFATTSRLRNEPPTDAAPPAGACGNGSRVSTASNGNFAGCEDIHFTPGYPFTVRLMTTLYLD